MVRMRALDLFKGRHFDREVIVLCVRWYLGFKLSSRDLVQMMAERGIALTHTTILRWVQRYVPEFEKRWNQYSRPVGGSWRCDETYIKVKGGWTYLYRAVDKQGRTVDFLLSERRDVAAAKRFFSKAMKKHGTPRVITLDAYAASHRAITELKSAGTIARRVRIRSSKYLNNVVEQDHRRIKQRVRPMLGFKRFETAAITISGIELAEKIRKQQFKTRKLAGQTRNCSRHLGSYSRCLTPSRILSNRPSRVPDKVCTRTVCITLPFAATQHGSRYSLTSSCGIRKRSGGSDFPMSVSGGCLTCFSMKLAITFITLSRRSTVKRRT